MTSPQVSGSLDAQGPVPGATHSASSQSLPRLWGVDLARFIAIVGMVAAHLVASRNPWPWVEITTSGFPSTLFAVLGGFGVVFAARRYQLPQMGMAAVVAGLVRGVLVLLLGVLLEELPPHPIAIILIYYGVALMCLAPAVLLHSRVLVAVAAVLAVVGPFALATLPHSGSLDITNPLGAIFDVFFGGTYPVITWLVYLLAGMVLCRWMLACRARGQMLRAAATMAVGGVVVGAASWLAGTWYLHQYMVPTWSKIIGEDYQTTAEFLAFSASGAPLSPIWDAFLQISAHSGSLVDILRTGGISVAIIGVALLVTMRLRSLPVLLRPIIAVGAAPLTSYTLHLLMTAYGLAAAGGFGALFSPDAPWWVSYGFVLQMAVLLLFGAALAYSGRRGPLESLISRTSQMAAGLVSRGRGAV